MQVTHELAEFVTQTDPAEIPPEALDLARRAVLDTLGVMLAGSSEDCARIAADMVRSREARPVATVVGQGFRSSPDAAALVNGVAAHALDYDDVNSVMTGHPSVPVVPALLATGEEMGISGRDFLSGYVIGFEAEVKLSRGMGPSHYARGWHATGTLGVIAAACVAARIYGLTLDQTEMAIGIAASLAGGMRQNFGTMTKPLHPGIAAQNGIVAAQLARRGYTADAAILESPLGFLNVFSPAGDARPDAVGGFGRPFEIVDSGISVKNYPCCFATHRALDATLDLASSLKADEISGIEVIVPQGSNTPLIHSRPNTGLEGKFSMEYCVAAALLDGRVGLDTFEDVAVQRSVAQNLLRMVEVQTTTEESSPAGGYAAVRVRLNDGRNLESRVDEPRGGPDDPLSLDELSAKFRECGNRVLGDQATQHALDLILGLDRLDSIRTLAEALGQPAAAPVS
jgi:2-methylcitrate dehydratase PrpD